MQRKPARDLSDSETLLLYIPAEGIISGFFVGTEQLFYENRQIWDQQLEDYEWDSIVSIDATHWMIIEMPLDPITPLQLTN